MKPRKQFTFYRNWYEAAQSLKKQAHRAEFLMAVCAYALDGTEPDGLSEEVSRAFLLIRPHLETGRRKALAGALGGSASSGNGKSGTNGPGGLAF